MARVAYRCEAPSLEAFIHRVAVDFVKNHYRYYAMGYVREGKDPGEVDARIVSKYRIDIDKWECHRRRRAGLANVQYVRHGRTFVILATEPYGSHDFFRNEAAIRDVRVV